MNSATMIYRMLMLLSFVYYSICKPSQNSTLSFPIDISKNASFSPLILEGSVKNFNIQTKCPSINVARTMIWENERNDFSGTEPFQYSVIDHVNVDTSTITYGTFEGRRFAAIYLYHQFQSGICCLRISFLFAIFDDKPVTTLYIVNNSPFLKVQEYCSDPYACKPSSFHNCPGATYASN